MELPNSEETVYQLYTIISNPSDLLLNQEPQENFYDVGEEDNQVLYVTLQQDEEEDEEEENSATLYKSDLCESLPHPPFSNIKFITLQNNETPSTQLYKSDISDNLPQPISTISSVKLLSLENGEIYLTTDNSADENLAAVQPHLLNVTNDTTSTNEIHLASEEQSEETTANENSDFHEVRLQDGTCALINVRLWNSLMEGTTSTEEPEIIKKKKFPCMYIGCGKSFTTAHHLVVHTRTHTGKRPYACTVEGCDKAFATGYSLKAHLRTHTGEKPYGCTVCLKHFKTSGDLQKHVRTHTGEKPFKCPIEGCDKSFTTSNIRKVHIRSHTGERPYLCKFEKCGKAFASATNYKNHMRIHSGEKPYVCQVEGCGKRFTEYSSLYKHNAVHLPYRNYQCDYCSQYFKFENTLKLHKKTVHGLIITESGTELLFSEDDTKSIVVELSETNGVQSLAGPILLKSDVGTDDEDDI